MCGKCEGCKALLRVALASRDIARSLRRDTSMFVIGADTMISPTTPGDVLGRDGCFVMVTPEMTDDDVITRVNEAYKRTAKSADRVLEILSMLAAAFADAGPSN